MAEDRHIYKVMTKSGFISGLIFSGALFFIPVFSTVASSQGSSDTTGIKSNTDTTFADKDHSLYAGAGYGSNMIYLGSTISQDKPFSYASLTYGFKNEIFASVSAIHLSGLDPFMAFYTASLNYSHVFNSWFDISAGIYRYNVSSVLTDTLFNSFTYGDVTAGFDWRILYTKLSAGGLISDESSGYFQVKNSRYFETREFFKNRFYVSVDPYVNLLFGTLISIETTSGTNVIITQPYRRWRNDGLGTTGSTTYTKKFGIMEIDFGIPVALNSDFMTIEAEASYLLPLNQDSGLFAPKGFVLMISGFFRIF